MPKLYMLVGVPGSGKSTWVKNQEFWMYDCLIPLDIVMVNDNIIETINSNCPPCKDTSSCEYYNGFGNVVLEFEGGTCNTLGIKSGDKIKIGLS